ncbi:MAG: FHA domain-containing protein [Deltaproteobacteria bacterium]|nr:FHA domain-containing protein [Deltaproteobacteria bacterium]MBW2534882.1 FHA domain-containing protein [Deltaproteobacteria bacterium]
MRYSFIHRGNVLPLSAGATLIGRSVACKVVIDDSDVSRRHARLTISAEGAVIEDLESANGVYVNGERISEPRRLANGDQVSIGHEELRLIVDSPQSHEAPSSGARRGMRRGSALDSLWDDDDDVAVEYGQATSVNQRVHMLTEAMQQLLASGEVDGSDPMLIEQMTELLERAEAGATLEERHADTAALVALRLARKSKEARWVEYVIGLHGAIGMTLPSVTLDEIQALAGKVEPVDLRVVDKYLKRLKARPRQLSPTERASLERFELLAGKLCAKR